MGCKGNDDEKQRKEGSMIMMMTPTCKTVIGDPKNATDDTTKRTSLRKPPSVNVMALVVEIRITLEI